MPPIEYLLDACAVLAFLKIEEGWELVKSLFDQAERGEIKLGISSVNLVEVYYDLIREYGPARINKVFRQVDDLPMTVIDTITPPVAREAAHLKAEAGMSLADTFLVSTALRTGATIVTCDHDELEPVARQGRIPFKWIRPRQGKTRIENIFSPQ